MTERTRLLLLSGAIWLVVTAIAVVFAVLGLLPWDGYLHIPFWVSALLGFVLGSLQASLIFFLTKAEA